MHHLQLLLFFSFCFSFYCAASSQHSSVEVKVEVVHYSFIGADAEMLLIAEMVEVDVISLCFFLLLQLCHPLLEHATQGSQASTAMCLSFWCAFDRHKGLPS